jgi:hypothetical protein
MLLLHMQIRCYFNKICDNKWYQRMALYFSKILTQMKNLKCDWARKFLVLSDHETNNHRENVKVIFCMKLNKQNKQKWKNLHEKCRMY